MYEEALVDRIPSFILIIALCMFLYANYLVSIYIFIFEVLIYILLFYFILKDTPKVKKRNEYE